MSSAPPASQIDDFRAATAGIECIAPDERVIVDGVRPSLVANPQNERELALTLKEAQAHRLAVIPVGAGRHLRLGNLPQSYDVAISTARLCSAIHHEPDDMTASVDAGIPLGALQRTLADRGQHLPIDPACHDDATIGGLLAMNAYGPARHAFGTLRDWVIGMRVAQANGTVTKSGGSVVKNVSGYDMHKLHIGALGSLGVITQVTFKLAPLPHVTATTTFAARSAADACAFVLRAHDAGLAIAAAEALSPSIARAICAIDGPCVLLRVSGSASAMARSLHDLRLFAREAGGAFEEAADAHWDQWTAAFMPAALSLRAAVLPSRTADAIHALEQRLAYAQAQISATVSAGVLRANVQLAHEDAAALIRSVRDVVERLGGTLVIETAPRQLKADLDVFGSTRSDFAIMRRLKEQFDPNHTLAPGRFVGRL